MERMMLDGIGPRFLKMLMAAVGALCLACEAQKSLEPVRQSGITAVSATLQGLASIPVADDVVVRVVDQRNNPMRNAVVTWTVAEGSITGSTTTNDNGEARAKWVLGPTLGQQVATAKTGSFSA